MLAAFRAEAVRDRADLRTRAERAERQADVYRDELAQLRAAPAADGITASKTARRTRQIAQP